MPSNFEKPSILFSEDLREGEKEDETVINEIENRVNRFFDDMSYWDALVDSEKAREYRQGIDQAGEKLEELADKEDNISKKKELLNKAINYREEALEMIGRAGLDKDWRTEQLWDLHRLYEKRKEIKTFVKGEDKEMQEIQAKGEKSLKLCLKGLSDPQVIFEAEKKRLEESGLSKIKVLKELAEIYQDFYKKVWASDLDNRRKEGLANYKREEYDEKYGLALWEAFFQLSPEELDISTREDLKNFQVLYSRDGLAQKHFSQDVFRKRIREIRRGLRLEREQEEER